MVLSGRVEVMNRVTFCQGETILFQASHVKHFILHVLQAGSELVRFHDLPGFMNVALERTVALRFRPASSALVLGLV